MVLKVPFEEVNGIIADKTPVKGLTVSYHSADAARVSYAVRLLGLSVFSVSANVRIISISESRVTAEVDTGSVSGFLLNKAKKHILEKVPEGLVELFDGKRAVLNLDAIPDLKSFFDNIAVNGMYFTKDAVCVEASVN